MIALREMSQPESLGTSPHLVGDCYSRPGQFAEALPWFERPLRRTGYLPTLATADGIQRNLAAPVRAQVRVRLQCVEDQRVLIAPQGRAPDLPRAACHREPSERNGSTETSW